MKANLFDQKNSKVGEIDLPKKLFGEKWRPALVHQTVIAHSANAREPIAHTKDRAEVRGGGRKPWRQKHTGRARHGSIRSPLWAGGGVTFGPRNEKNFGRKLNKKMRRTALFSVLSKKLADGEVSFFSDFNLKDSKTKTLAAILKNFSGKTDNILFITAKGNPSIFRAGRNIKRIKILNSTDLNVYDCLNHRYIFIDRAAVSEIENHFRIQK